jgi:hypothetical protein
MAIRTYTPQNKIIHQVKVDFVRRNIPSVVHLVQGDKTLPVIEIKMTSNNTKFNVIQELAPTEINIRCMNSDFSGVYTPILGTDEAGTSLYFEVPSVMTNSHGRALLVAEVKCGENVTNSSPFYLDIDKNPVWNNIKPSKYGGVIFEPIKTLSKIVDYEVITE